MKSPLRSNLPRTLTLGLSLLGPLCPGATSGATRIEDLEFEAVAELSREIGWFDAIKGDVIPDSIVRRFSLWCFEQSCNLTVVSIPASNCATDGDLSKLKSTGRLLEATQAGSDVDFFEMHKDGSGDLSVAQNDKDSVLIEFTSHELHQSKSRILVTYKNRFGPGGSKAPVKISGTETGIGQNNSLYIAGKELVHFEYRQLPSSTVCVLNLESRAVDSQ